MGIVGNSIRCVTVPEVPSAYEELQYIQLSAGTIAFDTGKNLSSFNGGMLKMETVFYCTGYAGIRGAYGYIFSYGRSAGFSSAAMRQSNGMWYLRRVRNTFTAGSAQVQLNTNNTLEYYDTAGTQYLKVNGTQVASSALTDAIVSPAEVYIGAYPGMAGIDNAIGRYGRFRVYDGKGLYFTSIPVRRKSDSAIGFLTTDRTGAKYFGMAQSYETVDHSAITAGSVVA